jgi:hypothetical protein
MKTGGIPVKVIVDIETHHDFIGAEQDHAVVEVTPELRDRIRAFHQTLNDLGAHYLAEFNAHPEFHFVRQETRIELVRLVVVQDGDFWWEGLLKNTAVPWQTGRITFALLDEPEEAVHDLRQYRAEKDGEELESWFINHYRHCGQEWEDRWSSACNDRCPVCNAEIEPYESEEIGAARVAESASQGRRPSFPSSET